MHPLKLSLLSPIKKTRLHKLIQFLFTKELLEMLILTCALLAVTQLVGWLILTQTVADLARSTLLVNKDTPPYVQDIKRINKLIKDVYSTGQDFDPMTPRIMELISTLPADIKLNAIDINRDQQTVLIDGVAATRDALINYEKVLDNVTWTADTSAPVSQLFQKENIGFQFQMKITGMARLRPLPGKAPVRPAPQD